MGRVCCRGAGNHTVKRSRGTRRRGVCAGQTAARGAGVLPQADLTATVTQSEGALSKRLSRSGSGRPRASAGFASKVLRGGRWRHTSPTVSPTLPDARTPQSHCPPPRRRQRLLAPERESLGVATVAMESGYTQQKVRPRRRARRQAVEGQGPAGGCALSVLNELCSGLKATQGAAVATHTDPRTGTAGLEAPDSCSSAARQRVPVCAVVALGRRR